MDKEIAHFIKQNYVLSLATYDGKIPYIASLFYLFFNYKIFFLSDIHTKHCKDILKNSQVAVSIYKKAKNIRKIKGVQLLGNCFLVEPTKKILQDPSNIFYKIYKFYIKKFPEAQHLHSYLWTIEPYWIKFTNNEIYFGFKKIWSK
ncbi:MAG: pyridoxamine 5'-phosphate oxidase family protein [Leptonema sp. (in: bacteria)]